MTGMGRRGAGFAWVVGIALFCFSVITSANDAADTTCAAHLLDDDGDNEIAKLREQHRRPVPEIDKECAIYMAPSTIPGAGLGIFAGKEYNVGDRIGFGDVLIPMIDMRYHFWARILNDVVNDDDTDKETNVNEQSFFDFFGDYIWFGPEMGMQHETSHPQSYIEAFAPGLDAAINCNLALINVEKDSPTYDNAGLRRGIDPGAGGISPYINVSTIVIHDIPAGGELFKHYGDNWFITRENVFGKIPLTDTYPNAESLMQTFYESFDQSTNFTTEAKLDLWNIIKDFPIYVREALVFPDDYNKLSDIVKDGIRAFLQPQSIRQPQELKESGRCLDNIRVMQSTLPQAGRGAFATRKLAKDSVITGTPLVFVPNGDYFEMYGGDWFDKDTSPDPDDLIHYQPLLNYCYTHANSSAFLCPYGVTINFINHNKTMVNAKWQWAKDGEMGHKESLLKENPDKLTLAISPGLFLDLVAIRDIEPGEEIFIDYGDAWEYTWEEHLKDWHDDPPSADYISAREWNKKNPTAILRTEKEEESDPYPEHFEMRCLIEALFGQVTTSEEALAIFDISTHGYICNILDRQIEADGSVRYKVEYQQPSIDEVHAEYYMSVEDQANDEWVEAEYTIVREAIYFSDVPYSTDIFLAQAFRYPIGIPDDVFPPAWQGYNISTFELNAKCREHYANGGY